jgi:hypothetical protein
MDCGAFFAADCVETGAFAGDLRAAGIFATAVFAGDPGAADFFATGVFAADGVATVCFAVDLVTADVAAVRRVIPLVFRAAITRVPHAESTCVPRGLSRIYWRPASARRFDA